jgi:hypothetical protein
MCHESSGTGLSQVIGVGKGTVNLDDFAKADVIFIIGQNPGTNHPRMFSTLLAAKRRGCKIVSVNPLKERSLVRFAHPQEVLRLFGEGTAISDLYQLRIGGDVALQRHHEGSAGCRGASARPGAWTGFIRNHNRGVRTLPRGARGGAFEDLVRESGSRASRCVRPRRSTSAPVA